jgi:hypothetical protein
MCHLRSTPVKISANTIIAAGQTRKLSKKEHFLKISVRGEAAGGGWRWGLIQDSIHWSDQEILWCSCRQAAIFMRCVSRLASVEFAFLARLGPAGGTGDP